MINKYLYKRLTKLVMIIFIVLLLYIFPKEDEYKLETKKVFNDKEYSDIYLINKDNYVSKTKIITNNNDVINKSKELITIMIKNNKYKDRVSDNFKLIINEYTKINKITYDNNILYIDFNKYIFDTNKENEELILEQLIYTLTSINGVNGINILIDGKKLLKLPKNDFKLDEILTREYGINKEYNIFSIKDINKVTIYYNSKDNNYVPVTKYINSNEDKIKIIIEELSSRVSINTNLYSYLSSKTKLIDTIYKEDEIDLYFNEYLYDDIVNKKVLEEVIYSISYSIEDTMKVSNIKFYVNNEEIKK